MSGSSWPRTRECVQIIALRPGLTRGEIAERMGCAANTAGQYLWLARRAGLVQPDGKGRFARWYSVSPAAAKARAPMLSSIWQMGVMP